MMSYVNSLDKISRMLCNICARGSQTDHPLSWLHLQVHKLRSYNIWTVRVTASDLEQDVRFPARKSSILVQNQRAAVGKSDCFSATTKTHTDCSVVTRHILKRALRVLSGFA